jgi:tRNA dimethylallyltransferase
VTESRHVALAGPTASGKSALALAIAQEVGTFELVSIDSMQVYRGMDIGTAKPSLAERALVPHHLIDFVNPDEEFTLAEFQRAARRVIADIEGRGKRALLVGGTGLYLQAITDNFEMPGQFPEARAEIEAEPDTRLLHARLVEHDPLAASRMEPDNRRRIVRALEVAIGSGRPFSSYGPGIGAYPETPFQLLALRMESERNAVRIETRVDVMFEVGLVDEVRLLNERYTLAKTARQALGYKEILDNLDALDVDTAAEEIKRRTRSFARRQRVWFRRDPRITFFDVDENPLDALPALLHAVSRPE